MSRVYTKAERVFKLRYSIKIPKIYTLSSKFLEQYAPPTSGDDEIDNQLLHEPIDMLITPAGIAMYISDGAMVEFNNPQDMVTIFEDTQALLYYIADTLNNAFIEKFQPPIKDIVSLDQLCKMIYPHVADIKDILNNQAGIVSNRDLLSQYMSQYTLRVGAPVSNVMARPATNRKPYVSVTKRFTKSTWSRYGNSRYAPA